ncbi:phosphotransferase enzyme family protein [Nocardia sp. NPDC003482]
MTEIGEDLDVEHEVEHVLRTACHQVGLRASGARLIKYTNNAVYALATEPVVIRIAGPSVATHVPKVIAVARWLAEYDMPSVRLVEDLPQPLIVEGRPVTFWHKLSAFHGAPTGHDLGVILRRLHRLPPPDFELPEWDKLAGIRRRIDEQVVLTPAEAEFLIQRCDQIAAALATITYDLPPGPIHGDGFVGNLIPGPNGPVICDFDSAATGPREWDLTPAAVGKLRFTYPVDHHRQLAAAYGIDVTTWPHFPILRDLRELQLVTSVLRTLPENPALRPQWQHRFTSLRNRDDARWSPYR